MLEFRLIIVVAVISHIRSEHDSKLNFIYYVEEKFRELKHFSKWILFESNTNQMKNKKNRLEFFRYLYSVFGARPNDKRMDWGIVFIYIRLAIMYRKTLECRSISFFTYKYIIIMSCIHNTN